MPFLLSIYALYFVVRNALLGVQGLDAASSLYTTGLGKVCDLSAELKGVTRYVSKELIQFNEFIFELQRVSDGIAVRRRNQTTQCEDLSLLQNYIRSKQRKVFEKIDMASKVGIKAVSAAAYAAGKIDEFFFELGQINVGATAGSSKVACLVVGGADATTGHNLIQLETAEQDPHVGKCFMTTQNSKIPEDGQLNFATKLTKPEAAGTFLSTGKVEGGCPLIKDEGSGYYHLAAHGIQTWLAGGGIFKFNGVNHASSVIQSHAELLQKKPETAHFAEADELLRTFKEQNVRQIRNIMDSAFAERTLEQLGDDEEFREALLIVGAIKGPEAALNKRHEQLYAAMLRAKESIKEALGKADEAATVIEARHQQYKKTCPPPGEGVKSPNELQAGKLTSANSDQPSTGSGPGPVSSPQIATGTHQGSISFASVALLLL